MNEITLLEKLNERKILSQEEYVQLLKALFADTSLGEMLREKAYSLADIARTFVYKREVFLRGLIEISNICKNDCLYCGIRRSNKEVNRYRLTPEEIMECCNKGYNKGLRTFVLQGGEDLHFTDKIVCSLITDIKKSFPDCAVTLSLGEKSRESYASYKKAGGDRYLLRHESFNPEHYQLLHPKDMSRQNRLDCLNNLKQLGYQTGCGFMVGSPGQTPECIAQDLIFIQNFKPQMVGIGPFLPHSQTPFANQPKGSLKETLVLLALIRIASPHILLPSTTALATVDPQGQILGLKAGANVIMPNISPRIAKENYSLYNGKKSDGLESLDGINELKNSLKDYGFTVSLDKGDYKVP